MTVQIVAYQSEEEKIIEIENPSAVLCSAIHYLTQWGQGCRLHPCGCLYQPAGGSGMEDCHQAQQPNTGEYTTVQYTVVSLGEMCPFGPVQLK